MTAQASRTIILSLAAIAAMGSLAMQLVVPSLPLMARDFGASAAAVQKVIGIYLFGLAAGQLIAGSVADRIGRRPVLVGGLLLFVLGSIDAALAPDLGWLLAARLVQALGGACGIITARVMVGDLFPPHEIATRQATIMSVVLLSPAVAPVIGGALAELAGWRAVFAVLAGVGSLTALISLMRMSETRTVTPAQGPSLFGAWRELFGMRRFTGHTMAIACGSASLYSFLASAPFLLAHEHGIGPRDTGLLLLIVAGTSIVGTKFVGRINRDGRGAITGAAICACGAALMVAFAIVGLHRLYAFILPMVFIGFGSGVLGPTGIAQVIISRPGLEGTASSLAGATQMTASAIASSLIGAADTLRLGIVVLSLAILALAGAIFGRRPMGLVT
jgi:DHA1 family bicyclomycin/chloramphenicol resistance-like MFS transporter